MVFGLTRTPQKYEERALKYESKGNHKKAAKNRAKAARLGGPAQGSKPSPTIPATIVVVPTVRTAAEYEAKAIKWEQRGDWAKAQKNREKVWRMNNKQLGNGPAPTFYRDNRFIGYAGNNNTPLLSKPAETNVQLPTYATQPTLQIPVAVGTYTPAAVPVGTYTSTSTYTSSDAYTTVGQIPVETRVHPTIIEQTVRTEKVTEIQPIIHREVEAPQVRVIEQHSYETVPSAGPSVITNQAVVETTVRPRVIEEIQPIVHREIAVPHVERVEQHVTEHVVKPTITTKEVITDSHVGVQYR